MTDKKRVQLAFGIFGVFAVAFLAWFAFAILFGSKPTVEAKTYSKPEIGMSRVDFHSLCGYEAAVQSLEDSSGRTDRLTYPVTSKAGCGGTFTFVNNELTSILR